MDLDDTNDLLRHLAGQVYRLQDEIERMRVNDLHKAQLSLKGIETVLWIIAALLGYVAWKM